MRGDNFRAADRGPSVADLMAVFAEIDRAQANPYPPGGVPDNLPSNCARVADGAMVQKICGRCQQWFERFYVNAAAARTANGLKYCDGCTKS